MGLHVFPIPIFFFFGFLIKKLFSQFWLRWVFVAIHRLSLLRLVGAALHCGMQASHGSGFSCCRALALGLQTSVVAVHRLRDVATGLVALRHVESSHIRDQTHVPCIGRWIPIYCHQGSPSKVFSTQILEVFKVFSWRLFLAFSQVKNDLC